MVDEPRDLHKVFEVWMDDETKLLITVFFQQNPGVIETIEGLARRLGTTADAIREAVSDHIELGILREKEIGDKVVLVYDKGGRESIEDFISKAIKRRLEEE